MLGDLSPEEFGRVLEASRGRSALPHLRDPNIRQRALKIASAQGLFQRIEAELTPDQATSVLPHSAFRDYQRTGRRSAYDPLRARRIGQLDLATMACYFGQDRIDYLQDLLWAECENTWWISPAEECVDPLDLSSTMAAARYAEILAMFADRMEPEVCTRLRREIYRRVLDPFLDPQSDHFWWRTTGNNWNAVCHGGICIAAMLLEDDLARLERILSRALTDLESFLDGFTDDGGCSEGPGYWRFGFGGYVQLAAALFDVTGGRVNIMRGEKILRICRYPLAVTIRPGQELTFADAHCGFQSPGLVSLINRFCPVPELYGLCRLHEDGTLRVAGLRDLLLYDGSPHPPLADHADHLLPQLGVAMVRRNGLTVGAKAGHNDEHHNHNDVGSFLVHRGQTCFLTDPGAPIYSRKTFSPQRYESVFTNSFGHSVPVVDGKLQSAGRQFRGTLAAENLNGAGPKRLTIDMAAAYEAPHLRSLRRQIDLPAGAPAVLLSDAYEFAEAPAAFQEAFITTHPAEVDAGGQAVVIRSVADGSAVLRAVDTPGRFRVEELTEQSRAESRHNELLRRIRFEPASLPLRATLRFRLDLA